MKKFSTLVAFILVVNFYAAPLYAQATQGVINYKVNVDSDNPQVKALMQDSKMTLTYKDGKSRADMDMGMSKNSAITDGDKTVVLIDAMGMKYKMNVDSKNNPKKAKDDSYDVQYTGDTMTIAGYLCKKVIIKVKGGDNVTTYVTDAINTTNSSFPYQKVKGFPLQFSMAQHGMSMICTATSVDLKTPVADSAFTYNDTEYQELTQDQIKQMTGGK